jgi:hypothetical protein
MEIVMIDEKGDTITKSKKGVAGAYQIIDENKRIYYSFIFNGTGPAKMLAYARAEGFIKGYEYNTIVKESSNEE